MSPTNCRRIWAILAATGRGHARRRNDEFLEKSAFGGASAQLKTVERFKPVRAGVIDWSITFRRCQHVGPAVDVRDAADARRIAACLRLRVP